MTKTEKKQLYRLPDEGKIAGVCAGIAEYTGMETWLVRIICFSGLVLSGSLFFIGYVAAWFILDKKFDEQGKRTGKFSNKKRDQWQRFEDDEIDRTVEVKSKVWQAGEPPRQAFYDIVKQFDGIERRVRKMEGYVTSNEFTLKREINRL